MTAPAATAHPVKLGDLDALAVGDPDAPLAAVILHGREMSAADLAPFARALDVPAYFVFPDAPLPCAPRGRTWWPIDAEARLRALATGPADLSTMDPPGRAAARELLGSLVEELAAHGRRVALAGFSQGGMLAMDYALHADAPPSALALLSSSPIAIADWLPRAPRLAGLPVLITHGRSDPELALAAGEHLAAFALAAGAAVTWLAFDGGHELPLQVWRALRAQLRALA